MTTNIDAFVAREAERATLTILVKDYEKGSSILARLTESDYADEKNRAIFREIQRRSMSKEPVDFVTLGTAMPGHMDELVDIVQGFVSNSLADQYIKLLKEATNRRRLYMLGQRVMERACGDVAETVEDLRLQLKAFERAETEEGTMSETIIKVHMDYYAKRSEDYLHMGIPALDATLIGLQPAALYVIGARPSVGKSVFGMIAAMRAGEAGKRSLIINREMEKEKIVMRMLANLSGLDIGRMLRRQLSEEEQGQLTSVYQLLDNMHIQIANKPKTIGEIREAALRAYEQDGLDLLVIDYLQRLSSGRRSSNRDEEVGAICWAMKDIAMDLKVPVILLSQLNRSASNNRPNMAQLRESGNIEQDADTVILLHKPDLDDVPASRQAQYHVCKEKGGKYLEMIVDKNRDGETALLPVMFHGSTMRFVPL